MQEAKIYRNERMRMRQSPPREFNPGPAHRHRQTPPHLSALQHKAPLAPCRWVEETGRCLLVSTPVSEFGPGAPRASPRFPGHLPVPESSPPGHLTPKQADDSDPAAAGSMDYCNPNIGIPFPVHLPIWKSIFMIPLKCYWSSGKLIPIYHFQCNPH